MSHFGNPWTLLAALGALGLSYVVLPVVGMTWRRYREPQIRDCPETGGKAALFVNARRAALTAAVGQPQLRVIQCSLWPQRKDCAQHCVKHA
jgi:hypothetical protein